MIGNNRSTDDGGLLGEERSMENQTSGGRKRSREQTFGQLPSRQHHESSTEPIPILVNHFVVTFQSPLVIFYHDVSIKPQPKSKGESDSVIEELLKDKFFEDLFVAFDGKKSLFSLVKIDLFKTSITLEEVNYKLKVKYLEDLNMKHVEDYLKGKSHDIHDIWKVIRGMDLMINRNMKEDGLLPIGRCLREQDEEVGDRPIVAPRELYQIFKLTSEGLVLCVDYKYSMKTKQGRDRMGIKPVTDRPTERRLKISNMAELLSGLSVNKLGLTVNRDMSQTTGRILPKPSLQIRDHNGDIVTVTPGKWELGRKVFEHYAIDKWGVLDFSQRQSRPLDRLIANMFEVSQVLGMKISSSYKAYQCSPDILKDEDKLHKCLQKIRKDFQGELQLLICVMDQKYKKGGYKNVRRIAETRVGIMTQYCSRGLATNISDEYLRNMLIKINVKTGGAAFVLNQERSSMLGSKGTIIFMGASMNRPLISDGSSHVAAMAGSINWPNSNKYVARFSIESGVDKMHGFGKMAFELVNAYKEENNGLAPDGIVLICDGVSQVHFEKVCERMISTLKEGLGYSPSITLLVAQKDHGTRIFPMLSEEGNVSAGTVVDSKIVHPRNFNFYICNHSAKLGTNKPVHYHVLHDEHQFSEKQLEELLYKLCFTYFGCSEPSYLAPPLLYAKLVALRAIEYYRSDDCSANLHPEIQNRMFFVD